MRTKTRSPTLHILTNVLGSQVSLMFAYSQGLQSQMLDVI